MESHISLFEVNWDAQVFVRRRLKVRQAAPNCFSGPCGTKGMRELLKTNSVHRVMLKFFYNLWT